MSFVFFVPLKMLCKQKWAHVSIMLKCTSVALFAMIAIYIELNDVHVYSNPSELYS